MKNYDALIIGFGKGGKTLAGFLASKGQKVALIEKSDKMYGGTCINVGCIPSKFLVNRSRQSKHIKDQKDGLFTDAVSSKQKLIEMLRAKNYEKLAQNSNIDVIDGLASFVSEHVICVQNNNNKQEIHADKIFINTGSKIKMPNIEGINDNPYVYDSDKILNLQKLPNKLTIIGSGYIGLEFASLFRDFGVEVTIIKRGSNFLPKEDEQIAQAVKTTLTNKGINIIENANFKSIEGSCIFYEKDNQAMSLCSDIILVATSRVPNTDGLNLKQVGIKTDENGGIITDNNLATNIPHIYALGDVRGKEQFTYLSLDDFRIVKSALFDGAKYNLSSRKNVPYSLFINPPLSRVGLSEQEAINAGYSIKVATLPAAAIPKAKVLENDTGLLKAIVDEKSKKILGVHLFCEESYEIINSVKLAMDANLDYTVLRDGIFTHPTMSEALNDLFSAII